jgi:hypothetical protein
MPKGFWHTLLDAILVMSKSAEFNSFQAGVRPPAELRSSFANGGILVQGAPWLSSKATL